jgi:prepilin-type N-terminal cleavage/methylation domain-containing protein
MRGFRAETAFTLIELLVVVAIIALLIPILLPALQSAKEEARRAVCLSHMRGIATASSAYGSEDERGLGVPVDWLCQSITYSSGWPMDSMYYYSIRLGLPRMFGGATPTTPIPVHNSEVTITTEVDGPWSAKNRPLNKHLYNSELTGEEAKDVRLFRCPSDTGYPETNQFSDCPNAARGIPVYDMLGNSYRINPAGFLVHRRGTFSVGVQGHALSVITAPAQVVMFCEPLFYSFSIDDWVNPEAVPLGWHNRIREDNVAYTDGSARSTPAGELVEWTDDLLNDMGVAPCVRNSGSWDPFYFLRRGHSWRTDTYPAPGARIHCYSPSGGDYTFTFSSVGGQCLLDGWPGQGCIEVAQWWR